MKREITINVYLFFVKILFTIFRMSGVKDRTVIVTYLGCNTKFVSEEIERRKINKQIVFRTKDTKTIFSETENRKVINLEENKIKNHLKMIFYLSTSKTIFVDNYFGFLASMRFGKKAKCIQLWHAAGAIKKFGLKDLNNKNRSNGAIKRFKKVYKRFNYVVVGSEKMKDIFKKAFNVPEKNFLKTGIPRTDLFYNEKEKQKIIENLLKENPKLKDKKVILYAPTFRDGDFQVDKLNLDIVKMKKELGKKYVLILKLHPLIKSDVVIDNSFVFDYSNHKDINELMMITNILITDYSSVAFEYSLLERPILFFAYDLEQYSENRGIWGKYEELVKGPIVENTNEIIRIIKYELFDKKEIVEFKKEWNQYSDGHSTEKLIDSLYKK